MDATFYYYQLFSEVTSATMWNKQADADSITAQEKCFLFLQTNSSFDTLMSTDPTVDFS